MTTAREVRSHVQDMLYSDGRAMMALTGQPCLITADAGYVMSVYPLALMGTEGVGFYV